MLELEKAREKKNERLHKNTSHRGMKVVSVTSGKGGVGKSSVAVSLAISIAGTGKKVLLLDGDFGLANLDILLDLRPRGTIHDVIHFGRAVDDVLISINRNLDILPASSGFLETAQTGLEEKAKLLEVMQSLEDKYDLLLIDTGAGISSDVTWLNCSAQDIVVVVTPEPTSIADAYALIKVLNQKHKRKDFRLLVNQAKSQAEALRVYQQITGVSDRFLNVSINYFGHILWDDLWTHAIRQRKPFVSAFPDSVTAKSFGALADILNRTPDRMVADGNVPFFKALFGHA